MDYVYIILIVIGILGLGFFLVPYLKNKNIVTDENIETTKQLLRIAKLIVEDYKFKNTEIKDKSLLIFNFADIVTSYVEQTMKFDDNNKKKEFAVNTVYEILKTLDIPISEANKKLVEIAIESAVNHLPKTYKTSTK